VSGLFVPGENVKDPRLLILTGVRRATLLRIPDSGAFVEIGRDADNTLFIPDRLASDKHSAVRMEGEHAVLHDRKSRNGTWINKQFWPKKTLVHSDRILCGTTVIIYLEHEDPLDAITFLQQEIADEELSLIAEETLGVTFSVSDTAAMFYRDVINAFSRMTDSLNDIDNLAALQAHLLDLIFDIIPARRGAILLNGPQAGPDQSHFISLFFREHDHDGPHRFFWGSLDSKALPWVYTRKVAYMINSPVSVLCLPLQVKGQIRGVLYLDTAQPQTAFTAEHLQFAGIAATNVMAALAVHQRMEAAAARIDVLEQERRAKSEIIGNSPAMQQLFDRIDRASKSGATILIHGETGTGKELVARAIHEKSARTGNAFVAINCGGLQEEFLQSELFGHVKGGYTGAVNERKGKFKVADKGTIFLDEMGELGTNMQAMLLRVLQDKTFYPLGSDRLVEVDTRVIAATHVDLEKAMAENRFRQDLFYRLNVYPIKVPPLRERREDIPLLVDYFLRKFARPDRYIARVASDAMNALQDYAWPGNVRELESAIQSGIIAGDGEVLVLEDLPSRIWGDREPDDTQELDVKEKGRRAAVDAEVAAIMSCLRKNDGQVAQTARDLGKSRSFIYKALARANTASL
jgi:Nif-specific regulatory protein